MAQLEMDRFEAWVRETGRGCLSDADMDAILQVECDIDGDGKFHFTDDTVQRDWEVWQAALADRPAKFWIPPGVYWNADKKRFYSAKSGIFMGFNFQYMWSKNSAHFPTSASDAYEVPDASK